MSHILIAAALIAAAAPATLSAQLVMTVTPDANRLEPQSRISFAATVPRRAPNSTAHVYRVRLCPEGSEHSPDCSAQWSSVSKDPGAGQGSVKLTFNTYTIPSGARSGDAYCFSLALVPIKVGPIQFPSKVVDAACKIVSVMNAVAGGPQNALGTKTNTNPVGSTVPRLSAPTASLPDLTLSFSYAGPMPSPRWIIHNVGKAASGATILRVHNAKAQFTREYGVAPLGAGDSLVITLSQSPLVQLGGGIQAYLTGLKAMVDPDGVVQEANKKNNLWVSPK
ncbi:MAG: CARDB domain-containing protein [Gemmatimonadota bacterium]